MIRSTPMAHSSDDGRFQGLIDHLHQTAALASKMAADFGCDKWGYLAGLWHDLGKYSAEFQKRICDPGGDNAHIEITGKVDHSTAGAKHAFLTLKNNGFGKAIAYLIAGHHGGLPDGISPDSCLRSKLNKVIPDYSDCPASILNPGILSTPLLLPFAPDSKRAGIQISLFIRILYSCLVDADFLDTEAFMNPLKGKSRQGYRDLEDLESAFFEKLREIRKPTLSPVNEKREEILLQCLSAAQKDLGLFSLTVPTGGGKTLSSMAFALRHARKHRLKRIIYVIPFTSIIEQNAEVFRSMLGDDSVLEHHSNFEPGKEDSRSRLAAENWDAPIIVTTNVQFFESLFANRSSRCRKLHNIANSVIILDEVQTLPAPYLLPCLESLKELAATYRVSIVLCSATQPAVQRRPDFPKGLEGVTEIIDNPQQLARDLKRTTVNLAGKLPDAELAVRLADNKQALCIVNTRRHAKELYRALPAMDGAIHLSALMCPAHRSQKLAVIRERLKSGLPCRVISTQLVEAGVDIDFPVVYRSLSGIDSIAQAAGRCNREGRLDRGEVFVFTPDGGIPADHLRQAAQTAESTIRRYPEDILSLEAIEDYFRNFYWMRGDGLDEEGILAMFHAGCQYGDFPFKTVAEKFHFINEEAKPVVIQFDDQARSLIRTLDQASYTMARKLQKYTVSIYPNEWNKLLSTGSIEIRAGRFPVLIDHTLYDSELGLCADDPTARDPRSLIT